MSLHIELGLLVFLLFAMLLGMYVMFMGDSERHEKVAPSSPMHACAAQDCIGYLLWSTPWRHTCRCVHARRAGLHRLSVPANCGHHGVFQQVRSGRCATRVVPHAFRHPRRIPTPFGSPAHPCAARMPLARRVRGASKWRRLTGRQRKSEREEKGDREKKTERKKEMETLHL
jgi:hypothetical protein